MIDGIVFTTLKPEHLSEIAEIERNSFDMPWNENMLAAELDNENSVFIVGTNNGSEIVCYGGFHKVLDEAHINNIAVRKAERGVGLGKTVMTNLIGEAKKRGVARMTLEVSVNNATAVRLYESIGFKTEGTRKRYYLNKYDALVMWLDI